MTNNYSNFHLDLFHNLHDHLPGVFYRCSYDADWTMLYLSEGVFVLTGYVKSDLLNNETISYSAIIHPDDQTWLAEKCEQNLRLNEPCNNTYRIITKNGSVKWVNEIANGVYDENNQLKYIEGYISEVKKEEELALISSAFQSYQSAINEHALVLITNIFGSVLFVNEKFTDCIEYSREELLGENISILKSEEHDAAFFEELWSTVLSGKIWHRFIRNKTKSGRLKWFDMVISPVTEKNGKINQFLAILNDVTDQVETNKKLEESEERLRQAQSIAKIGSWEFELAENKLSWSPELYRIFDVSLTFEGDLTHLYFQRIHPDSLADVQFNFQRAIEEGVPYEMEHKIVLEDGSEVFLFCTGGIAFDEFGKSKMIYGTAQDISHQKKQEEELNKLSKLSQQIIETSNEMFYVYDYLGDDKKKHKLTFISDNVNLFYGIEREEFVRNPSVWFELIHPDDQQHVLDCMKKLYSEKQPAIREYRVRNAITGNYEWFSDYSKPVCHSDGSIHQIFGSVSNISEKKEKEAQLEKTVVELRNRYNDMMQFNYIVSHNLRAPLANIIGTVNLYALDGVGANEKQTIIDYIKTSSGKMDQVLKDLNAILASKDATTAIKETVFIEQLIRTVLRSFEKQFKEVGMEVYVDSKVQLLSIFTIKSYLESICFNMITNAFKYRRLDIKSELRISLEIENNRLVITFSDNGLGIDLEKYGNSIFGLYKRFHHQLEGKGMGLFMTKTQLQTMGGEIFVESKPNEGAMFKIVLPV